MAQMKLPMAMNMPPVNTALRCQTSWSAIHPPGTVTR